MLTLMHHHAHVHPHPFSSLEAMLAEPFPHTPQGFPIVLAKFTLLRNYTFFHNEF